MEKQFSDTLVQKMITYAARVHGKKISADEAEGYLNSLARVYLTFYEIEKRKKGGKKPQNHE
jgi:hypothetical protein